MKRQISVWEVGSWVMGEGREVRQTWSGNMSLTARKNAKIVILNATDQSCWWTGSTGRRMDTRARLNVSSSADTRWEQIP